MACIRKVGVDIPAGEYKVIPSGSTAYLEVSTNSSHSMSAIVSNDLFEAERYTTIKDGQYLKVTDAKIKLK